MTGEQQQRPGTPTQTTQQQQQMIPKYRFDEILDRVRALEDQNNQLRGTLDAVYTKQQQAQQPQQQEESPFEPGTRKAIQQEFQKLLDKEKQTFGQQLGHLYDRNDELAFQVKYGQKYGSYSDRIDRVRQERARQGAFISREDALKLVVFEETGRKPQPTATKPTTPVLDPYTQRIVEPEVTTEEPQMATTTEVDLNDFQPTQPMTQQRMQEPELPPAAIMTGAPVNRGSVSAPKLSLDSDEKALAAWEQKHGDINF
jgi:hypothetical protein